MASVIAQVKIPSAKSGELYTVTEYDDGTIRCTCAFGSRHGPISPGGKSCKHVKKYRAEGPGDGMLSPAFVDADIDFNSKL